MTQRRTFITALAGIASALILGVILLRLFGYRPFDAYAGLLHFSLGGHQAVADTAGNAVPLVLCGLSASLAFSTGAVNLGQPGQFLMGALCAVVGGIYLPGPAVVVVPLCLLSAALGGAVWAGIAGVTRRRLGMEEFIVTLMLNFVADYLTQWLIASPLADPTRSSPTTRAVRSAAFLPSLGRWSIGVPVTVVVSGALWFLVHRSTIGYEWRMAGGARRFARLGGVAVERNVVAILGVSGGMAGLGGGMLALAGPHRFVRGIGGNYGWDGVMIAVVAASGLVATVAFGLFFSALQTGAIGMELRSEVPTEFVQILEATVVLITVAVRGVLSGAWVRFITRRSAAIRSASRSTGPLDGERG